MNKNDKLIRVHVQHEEQSNNEPIVVHVQHEEQSNKGFMTESQTVKLNKISLARVGVERMTRGTSTILRCMTCGHKWTLDLNRTGKMPFTKGFRLPDDWWKCPINPEHTKLKANEEEN